MSSAFVEVAERFFGGNRGASFDAVFKFSNIHPRVQQHLSRVYFTLACAVAVVALGCYASIAGLVTLGLWSLPLSILCLLGLAFISHDPKNLNKRYACLAGFSFCQGSCLAPLVNLAIAINPVSILTATLCCCAVFLCFSLSALTTQRRSYMYLQGYLAAATAALLVMRLGSIFAGPTQLMYSMELYGGLLMFSAYILYDTQLIVERASAGDMDHVGHSLQLLADIIPIFVRILHILINNAEQKRKREEEERRRRK